MLRGLPIVTAISSVALASAVLLLPGIAASHPEDEFCVPGEGGLDPALCEALSTLDSSDATDSRLEPILDVEGNERGVASTLRLYVGIGVRHILPAGLDHILFVLALFLSSPRTKALVLQISMFTVAHTATLGLAAAGVISPASAIVEPLIAATIAFVAIENLVLTDMPRRRPAFVLAFGLVHGLGFAGFFGELGLPPGQFWSALIGFNVGVEIGQLSVILLAVMASRLLPGKLFSAAREGDDRGYRRAVVMPLSALIAAVGLFWTVERIAARLV